VELEARVVTQAEAADTEVIDVHFYGIAVYSGIGSAQKSELTLRGGFGYTRKGESARKDGFGLLIGRNLSC
jgi:hypothetical protein